jgi:hypothetical protein
MAKYGFLEQIKIWIWIFYDITPCGILITWCYIPEDRILGNNHVRTSNPTSTTLICNNVYICLKNK